MARSTTTTKQAKQYPPVQAIMDGDHDDILALVQNACQARLKDMFRKGMKVRLHGTSNPTLEGKIGVVLKVNTKRITVGVGEGIVEGQGTPWAMTIYDDGKHNVPPSMLERVI